MKDWSLNDNEVSKLQLKHRKVQYMDISIYGYYGYMWKREVMSSIDSIKQATYNLNIVKYNIWIYQYISIYGLYGYYVYLWKREVMSSIDSIKQATEIR